MTNFRLIVLVLMVAGLASRAHSQGNLAPLYVFTNGDGSITPYQSGQMLEAGQTYDLTATPDAGYQFVSWEPVDVFIITTTNYLNGEPIFPIVSIDPLVVATNVYGADLEFTMQDVTDITAEGENPNIVQAFGWQANFEPLPEPTDAAIVGSGFTVMAVVRRRTWQKYRILKPFRKRT